MKIANIMKRPQSFLLNPDANEPTAGLRGLLCLVLGGCSPMFLDWRTMFFPLLIAVLGGIGFGVGLLAQAWVQTQETYDLSK